MTVSGTISTTAIDVADIIQTAFRRCRIRPEQISADMLASAKAALGVALSAMPHRGFQLWTLDEETTALVEGDPSYALAAGTLDVKAVNLVVDGVETGLSRVDFDQYVGLPDKSQTGRPTMYWVDLQRDAPVLNLWPAPDATWALASLKYWRKRYIMDVGAYTATLDIPQGWHDAVIADLAARLALETPEVEAGLVGPLRQIADNALILAQRHNTDAAPLRILPRIGRGG